MSVRLSTRRLRAAVLGLLSLVACAEPPQPAPPAAATAVPPAATPVTAPLAAVSPPGALPREKAVLLDQEGQAAPLRLRLYESSLLPFVTYYPADMVAEELPQATPARVRFAAHFGGKPTPGVFLEVSALPPGQDESLLVRELKQSYPNVRISTPRGGFVIREYRYGSSGARPVSGRLLVSVHNSRYFVLRQEAPVEALEGLGVRAGIIQKEWIWSDSGKRLLGS